MDVEYFIVTIIMIIIIMVLNGSKNFRRDLTSACYVQHSYSFFVVCFTARKRLIKYVRTSNNSFDTFDKFSIYNY